MEIEYDLTLDDLLAYNLYHMQHSSTVRRQMRIAWLGLPAICFVAAGIALMSENGWVAAALAVLGGVFLLIFPRIYRRSALGVVNRMLGEGNQGAYTGRHRLRIDEQGVTEITESSESKMTWSAIDKIVVTDEYAFFYIGPVQACILPRRSFSEPAAFRSFVGEAEKFLQDQSPARSA